jgi:REP element-mobilizing transposase RayT
MPPAHQVTDKSPAQNANINDENKARMWFHPVDTTRHHRENGWDYRGRAIYHFTLPIEERYPLFGVIEGGSAETAAVRLNAFGQRVCLLLRGLPQFYAKKGFALKVLATRVMPDHIHLVIQVLEPLPRGIGAVVRGFKSACTSIYKREYYKGGENAAKMHEDENANSTFVHFDRIFAVTSTIWQSDKAYYHERILHAPGQLRHMIDYVKDNPRRLWLKKRHPDLFKIHRRTQTHGLIFTSLGNHFLLDWPDRQMVELSRNTPADEVEQRLAEALAAAQNGAITYTAAISKGEQLIARTLRQQGFPLVILLNDGFPKEGSPHERYFKPGGVYFEACAEGRLLLLEPTAETFLDANIQASVQETLRRKAEERHYSYSPLPVSSQRYRFVALNEMARMLIE